MTAYYVTFSLTLGTWSTYGPGGWENTGGNATIPTITLPAAPSGTYWNYTGQGVISSGSWDNTIGPTGSTNCDYTIGWPVQGTSGGLAVSRYTLDYNSAGVWSFTNINQSSGIDFRTYAGTTISADVVLSAAFSGNNLRVGSLSVVGYITYQLYDIGTGLPAGGGPPPPPPPCLPTPCTGPPATGMEATFQNGLDMLRHDPCGFYIANPQVGFSFAPHADWTADIVYEPPMGQNVKLAITERGEGIDMIYFQNLAQVFDAQNNPMGPYNLLRLKSYDLGTSWTFEPPDSAGQHQPFLQGVKWARNLYLQGRREYALLYNDTSEQDSLNNPTGRGYIQFISWDTQNNQQGPCQVCQDIASDTPVACIEVLHPTKHLRACWQDGKTNYLRHFFSFDDGRTWREITELGQLAGSCPALAYNERTGEYGIAYNDLSSLNPDGSISGNGLLKFRIYDVQGNLIGDFPSGGLADGNGMPITSGTTGIAVLWAPDRTHHIHFACMAPTGTIHSVSFDDGRTWSSRNPYS